MICMARRGRPSIDKGCSIEGCKKKHHALGLCRKHYSMLRYKKPSAKLMAMGYKPPKPKTPKL